MDPRDRADALLARAQTRKGVVTPDNMTSPMDSANTQKIPRSVVHRIDTEPDPDMTTKLPSSVIEASDPVHRESHLTEPMQTTPLQQATEEATVTQPLRTPRSVDEEAAGPDAEDGLVPTTKTPQQTESFLARRLEGL